MSPVVIVPCVTGAKKIAFFYHFSTDCLNAVSILLSVQYDQSIQYIARGRIPYFHDIRSSSSSFFVLRSSFFTALPVTLLNSAPNSVKFDHNMEANYRTLKIELV